MKLTILILLGTLVLMGCSKDKKSATPSPPGKATLLLPAQNEVCTQGSVLSATQSIVTLKWAAASNAETYDITIKDLEDGTSISKNTSDTKIDVTLKRNTPFSWSVTSKSASVTITTKSDTWKFYNSGPANVSYAPFPAEIIAPIMNQKIITTNGTVTLSWAGSDVDNDIADYDIYCSDSPTPTLQQHNITANITEVAVVTGKTYYWRVITRDSEGNQSDSGTYKFTTE